MRSALPLTSSAYGRRGSRVPPPARRRLPGLASPDPARVGPTGTAPHPPSTPTPTLPPAPPAEPAVPPASQGAATASGRRPLAQDDPERLALLDRLRALHAEVIGRGAVHDGATGGGGRRADGGAGASGRGGALTSGTATDLAPLPTLDDFDDDDDRPLDVRLGAERRVAKKGVYWLVERRFPLASRHGAEVLATAFERAIPLRQRERRPGGRVAVHPDEAVFLDVETTGLAGGTGTLAFLVGAARRVGDDLVLKQYFVPDFPDEAAVLDALAEDLGDAPLVTFNGRTFDAPLLATRFRLHRIPFADRDHLDLLPPARRLWAASLDSHALSSLERRVLGVARTEDLPGALVPAAYFAWLRDGRAAALSLAFRHNETDLVSLVTLAGVVARLVADPTSRPAAPVEDHLHTARLLLDHGDPVRARACLAAVAGAGADAPPPVRRLLASLQRRGGDLDAALATWSAWLEAAGPFDAHPYEEIAKHLEHRVKDPVRALSVVERALARCPRGDPHRDDLERRRARLARKAAAASRPATPTGRRSSATVREARPASAAGSQPAPRRPRRPGPGTGPGTGTGTGGPAGTNSEVT